MNHSLLHSRYQGRTCPWRWRRTREPTQLTSAAMHESNSLESKPVSGSCDDVWKAYDGIPRELAMVAACLAGFPKKFGGGLQGVPPRLGRPLWFGPGVGSSTQPKTAHFAGIPLEQCPLGHPSRPRLLQLKAMAAVPTLFADDLETMAVGCRHRGVMKRPGQP